MQQATVNLLADMGAQPATLQSALIATSGSTDTTPPTATISSPAEGAHLNDGSTDDDLRDRRRHRRRGRRGRSLDRRRHDLAHGERNHLVDLPVDRPRRPSTTIKARAIDDSGNIGAASAARTVTVSCPCSIFGGTTPADVDAEDAARSSSASSSAATSPARSAASASTNRRQTPAPTSAASGPLRDPARPGELHGESASGWQQVNFSSPVAIQPNTTYVAAYFAPNGHYSATEFAMDHPPAIGPTILDAPPLHVLPDTGNGNGLYQYTRRPPFPQNTYQSENYWVDVVFSADRARRWRPGQVTNVTATAGALQATVNWTRADRRRRPSSYLVTPYIGSTAQTAGLGARARQLERRSPASPAAPPTPSKSPRSTDRARPGIGGLQPGHPDDPEPARGPDRRSPRRRGALQATVNWTTPAGDGGSPITELPGHALHRGDAPRPRSRSPRPPTRPRHRPHRGHDLHLQGRRDERARHRARLGPFERGHPDRRHPARAHRPGSTATAKSSGAQLTWTAPASDGGSTITSYRITPYIGGVAQTPTTTGSSATSAQRRRPHQRHRLHLHGRCDQCRRHRPGSAASSRGHPLRHDLRPRRRRKRSTPATAARSSSGSSSAATSPARSTASASTNRRPTPAPTSAASGPPTGTLLAQANFSGESASGWQQVKFTSPVAIQAEHDLRRRLPGAERPLLGERPDPRFRGRQRAAARARQQHQRQRRLHLRSPPNSRPTPTRPPTTGSTSCSPRRPGPGARPPTGVSATAGQEQATVNWTAPASDGGSPITSYRVTPYIGTTAQTPVTVAAPATSKTITGLTGGTPYTFKVAASTRSEPGRIAASNR